MTWSLQNPWLLLLLAPALAAFVHALRTPQPAIRVGSVSPYRACAPRRGRFWLRTPLVLEFLALCALIVALARPRAGIERIVQRSEGVDIVLCLDVSGSMESYDVPETMSTGKEVLDAIREKRLRNRVDVAKLELKKFVRERPNDRIGLIAFAELPYVVCPPTLDHDFLLQHLDMLEASMLGDSATGIASPVASASQRLKDSEAKARVAVLFTDGENNVEARITPRQAARIADTFDIRIHTVGVGSDRAVRLTHGWRGPQLRQSRGRLDENLLRDIAGQSGGRYFAARDAAGFQRVMDEIDRMETIEYEMPRYIDYTEHFQPPLYLGASLLLIALLLNHTLLCKAP